MGTAAQIIIEKAEEILMAVDEYDSATPMNIRDYYSITAMLEVAVSSAREADKVNTERYAEWCLGRAGRYLAQAESYAASVIPTS